MSSSLVFIIAAVAYVVLATSFAIAFLPGDTDEGLVRWCLWTNIFFLWPTVRALLFATATPERVSFPAAWGEAAIFFVTFTVSTLHHGCLNSTPLRQAVAAETYWLLFLGTIAALLAIARVGYAWLTAVRYDCRDGVGKFAVRTGPDRCPRDANWRDRAWGCLIGAWVVAFALIVAAFVVALVRTPDTLDGCAFPHAAGDAVYEGTTAVELARIWGGVDFVTAVSALAIGILWLLQTTDTLNLAMFWVFAVVVTMAQLYRFAGLVAESAVLVAAAIVGGAFLLCQCVVCCSYPTPVVGEFWGRYDKVDAVLALLVGAAALFLFFGLNSATGHGWWHVFGGLALYFIVESLYRKRSLFVLRV